MTATWQEVQKPWMDAAERLGIHVDEVQGWMLDPDYQRKCDHCHSAVVAKGYALCDACTTAYATLATSYRPEVIAARQGATLVYSDGKDEPGVFNATTDKHGRYGLHFAGGVV